MCDDMQYAFVTKGGFAQYSRLGPPYLLLPALSTGVAFCKHSHWFIG